MINVKIPLHGMEKSVVRPIILSVSQDILKSLGLKKDVYLQMREEDKIKVELNKLGEVRGANNTKFEYVLLDWDEESEPEFELSTIPINPDFQPIWIDDDIESKATPILHPRKLNIKFKYNTMSESGIHAVANNLRVMTANDAHTNMHDLEYDYNVGDFFSTLLIEINRLKNLREPEDKQLTLEDYIANTFDDRVDLTYSLDGDLNKAQIVIREAQLECIGYIEDDIYNIRPEFDESTNMWYIEFSYTISYEKPIALKLNYPILIYNTLLPSRYRNIIKPKEHRPNAYRTGRISSIVKIANQQDSLKPLTNNDFLRIPKQDNVKLPRTADFISRMFSVLCVLNPDDKCELFNLKDIPGLRFKEEISHFLLTSEYPYVGDVFNSIFFIELYENEHKVYNNKVLMDNEGNLRTQYPLDIKKIYRVMFNIINNISYLDIKAQNRITKYMLKELEDKTNDGKLIGDTFNITYYKIFNVNTPYPSQYDKTRFATEDIRYWFKKPAVDSMKTKAWGHIIVMREVLEEKK